MMYMNKSEAFETERIKLKYSLRKKCQEPVDKSID